MKLQLFCLVIAILLSTTTFSQRVAEPDLNQQLQKISEEMYESGKVDFILVQALVDSLVRDGVPFDYLLEGDHLAINGKELPSSFEKTYRQLLDSFYNKSRTGASVTDAKNYVLNIEDVFNPYSAFRSKTLVDVLPILYDMRSDKLIDARRPVKIAYSLAGIWVNGKRLSTSLEEKYKKKFKELGVVPKKPEDQISFNTTFGSGGPCFAPKRKL